jgi:phthiocerol/phenolphthiocerol synthesis type-I polyketide synthase C
MTCLKDAIRHLQNRQHIGKVVLQMPITLPIPQTNAFLHYDRIFNAKSSYLVTGGMGGIGIELTRWMIECGAQEIILIGRSSPSLITCK